MNVLWWIGIALLCIVVEMVSLTLVLVTFAGGAVAAAIANLLGAPVVAQFVIFAAVSGLLLVALRPWLLRRLRQRMPLVETNVAAHVGRVAVVVTQVGPRGGRIKLSGEVWSARTAADDVRFPVGAQVQVVRIDGATAVVAAAAELHPAGPSDPAAPGAPSPS